MSAIDDEELERRIDAVLAAQPGVMHLYPARPVTSRAVRAVSGGAEVACGWVRRGSDLRVTASVGVSSRAGGAALAAGLAAAVRGVPGLADAAVRIRVSRIVPADEGASGTVIM